MGKSDKIEAFILELIKQEEDEWTKIQRNELASIFNCVPSQINYVIETRFNPDRGYMVETRRGGGGYVIIRRIKDGGEVRDAISQLDGDNMLLRLYNSNAITNREARMLSAVIKCADNDNARARILKTALNELTD